MATVIRLSRPTTPPPPPPVVGPTFRSVLPTILAAITVLGFILLSETSHACSDPVKHREHLLQEMKAAEGASGGSGSDRATQSQSARNSALDDEKSFFGSVGASSEPAPSDRPEAAPLE